ncbi:hydroxyphenylacetyl-CoA thioesterase PaaI [Sediminibacterium ginsengisoli]|uniref:Acyl-CoA thioesterase n=1 Tax=Sediminibacterium ginsengisoli TaxID=413434 RepID=A0A1T4JRD9_9BACT|nr:hydroxyphenylacetyl-CoA thioesterase PaaI [Sediminibacterium ginsengisoli]SJZ32736.1 acyl-CoA thioesterase [Sediminibacterium ginsengisoli]
MTDKDSQAVISVDYMMKTDLFSQWLGISVLEVKAGYSKIQMTLRREMMNAFGIAHGGVTFAFADSAFAFACNSDGKVTVALDVSISFPKAGKEGDVLFATARRVNTTRRTGLYLVEVTNADNEMVALFKGTCYKTEKDLIDPAKM